MVTLCEMRNCYYLIYYIELSDPFGHFGTVDQFDVRTSRKNSIRNKYTSLRFCFFFRYKTDNNNRYTQNI